MPLEFVVGVRAEDGRDYIVDSAGLNLVPNECSAEFPVGSRVFINNVEKTFPKFDEMARKLFLSSWKEGGKPSVPVAGTVSGSVKHPSDETVSIVGVHTEEGNEYLVEGKGLTSAPQAAASVFPANAHVRIVHPEKVYPKMDTAAAAMTLTKWRQGATPKENESATVLASVPHPAIEGAFVFGVRTDSNFDYVVAAEAIVESSNASSKFPIDTRVRIVNADKIYPKMDEVAKQLNLGRWIDGAKPATVAPAVTAPANDSKSEEDVKEGTPAKKAKVEASPSSVCVPLRSAVGVVRGSVAHPSGNNSFVVAVHTDAGPEYLIAEEGLEATPEVCTKFPYGSRVSLELLKVYPKWDEKAEELHLPKWTNGQKPATNLAGKVTGSCSK